LESDLLNPLTTLEDMATAISMYPDLTLIMVSVCIMVLARGLLSLVMDTTMEATAISMFPGPTLTMESVFIMVLARGLLNLLTTMAVPIRLPMSLGPTTLMATV